MNNSTIDIDRLSFDEDKWKNLLDKIKDRFFVDVIKIQDVIFFIGIQELGLPTKDFTKAEKIDLLHVGTCALLAPFGFYEFEYKDEDGWPHFKTLKKAPDLPPKKQSEWFRKAILYYFSQRNNF